MVAVSASVCWRSGHDIVGQPFQCVRASVEALSVRVSGRGRRHRSAAAVLLQVRLTKHGRHTFVLRISLVLHVTRSIHPCALSKRAPYAFISSRLQQSLVPQTCGARGGEPKEKHVGSYLAAFFRLLGESAIHGYNPNSVSICAAINNLRKF